MFTISRRHLLLGGAAAIPAGLLRPLRAQEPSPREQATITAGDLKAAVRDNSDSPRILSGLDSLVNQRDAPDFDAYDPDSPGASAGLNFEHIISGHKNPNNAFSPRKGPYRLQVLSDGKSAVLVRKREDDPWAMSSTLKYTIAAPHAIDVDFQCTPHDASLFGKRRYAILFFANYMNDVAQPALNFRGIEGPDQAETWVAASTPNTHPDWNQGGTYRSAPAAALDYDADHNFKLNSWSYDYPRFTQPFYYGRAARGMVFLLMFNKMYSEEDEIRFSLFKFKLRRFPRPAWDFQYVIRRVEEGKSYGFKARLVWKTLVSADDCLKEYETWAAGVGKDC